MKMVDLILVNGEKIAKFAEIKPLQNYQLHVYGIRSLYVCLLKECRCFGYEWDVIVHKIQCSVDCIAIHILS